MIISNQFIISLVITACNIDLTVTNMTQYVATEGYPIRYKRSQDCRFNFKAPSGRRIEINFEEFDLGNRFDYIIIRKLQADTTALKDTHLKTIDTMLTAEFW